MPFEDTLVAIDSRVLDREGTVRTVPNVDMIASRGLQRRKIKLADIGARQAAHVEDPIDKALMDL